MHNVHKLHTEISQRSNVSVPASMSYIHRPRPENLSALCMHELATLFQARRARGRLLAALVLFSTLLAPVFALGEDWPGWRGPRGDGTSLETAVPARWNGATGLNLAWTTQVPGSGHA